MADLFSYQTLKRKPRKGQRIAYVSREEWVIQQAIVRTVIEPWLRRDWRFTHIANGELRDDATAGKLRGMGLRPGFFDLEFFSPEGRFFFIEVKRRPTTTLKGDQARFAEWLDQHGLPYAIVWTEAMAFNALESWGALRITTQGGGVREL